VNYRKRGLEERVLSFAENFKVVLLTGARQVGKSTLLAHLFPKVWRFVFDPWLDRYGVKRNPDLFLDQFPPPLILDEIQNAPELLPSIKRRVDESGKPGDYLLSGFYPQETLKTISESFEDRVGILTLESMTWRELNGWDSKTPWIADYLASPNDVISGNLLENKGLYRALWRGAMPGTLEMPDESVPDYHRAYVKAFIEHHVKRQGDRNSALFVRFASVLNSLSGQELDIAKVAKRASAARRAVRKWATMLDNCYQWRELMPWNDDSDECPALKSKGFSRDSGLCCWFLHLASPKALVSSSKLDAIFETFIVNDVANQLSLMSSPPRMWRWYASDDAEVALALVLERDGFLFPVEIKCKSELDEHDLNALSVFMKTYPDKAKAGIVIYTGRELYKAAENVTAVPWSSI
jgi:predicted AAA+ superfamily ATPase